jgi:hypothetical protein
MDWPTWKQASLLALACGLVGFTHHRLRIERLRAVAPAAWEIALVSVLYSIWRIARELPLDLPSGAISRARQIDRLQHALRMPTELSLQHLVLRHDWLAWLSNAYYAVAHVPGLVLFMVWLYVRHRDRYPHWRNGLAILTGLCLVIRFVRVAPPRFLGDLGYVDLATRYGMSLYGSVGTGVSDQFAAMPSIHVGWAAVVSFGVLACSTSRWRWLVATHVVWTMIVVSATGNHWWLDGIVAMVLLGVGLAVDTRVRYAVGRSGQREGFRQIAPVLDGQLHVGREDLDADVIGAGGMVSGHTGHGGVDVTARHDGVDEVIGWAGEVVGGVAQAEQVVRVVR